VKTFFLHARCGDSASRRRGCMCLDVRCVCERISVMLMYD